MYKKTIIIKSKIAFFQKRLFTRYYQMKKLILSIFFLVTLTYPFKSGISANAPDATEEDITISVDTEWGPGLVEITDNVKVLDNVTLTIKAGTTIEFSGFYRIDVWGCIKANGTSQNEINFTIKDTTGFSNRFTPYGGWSGIWFDNSTDYGAASGALTDNEPSVFNYCNFSFSKAIDYHPSDYADFGGTFIIRDFSNISFNNCQFVHCSAENGGSVAIVGNSAPSFDNCVFTNNVAKSGGALFCDGSSSPVCTNCIFANNKSMNSGGAISIIDDAFPKFSNVIINNNSSSNKGGAIFSDNNSELRLLNSSLVFNYAEQNGGATYINSVGNVEITNSIIWGNRNLDYNDKQMYGFKPTPVAFQNCDIEGGNSSWFGNTALHSFTDCIEAYPDWISPPEGVGELYTFNLQGMNLSDTSPCVNAGTIDVTELNLPLLDLLGNNRIGGGKIDIGAIENQNVQAPPEYFLRPKTTKVYAKISENNTVYIDVIKINISDFAIEQLTGLSAPFSATTEGDRIKVTAFSNNFGFSVDTLVVKTNYGDKTVILDFVFGLMGNVEGSWNKDTIIVSGDLTVSQGRTLLIEPGIDVLFAGNFGIEVQGKLLALGFENDNINFNTIGGEHKWTGISFANNNSVDTSKIYYSRFENSNNTNGGALRVDNFSRLRVTGSYFANNTAEKGGSIALENNSNPIISHCTFRKSVADYGGAIYCSASSPTIQNSMVLGNIAEHGGGIYCDNLAQPLIINSQFRYNKSYSNGGAVFCDTDVAAQFIGNIISDNVAAYGGAIYCFRSSPTFINNTICNNSAFNKGGGVFCSALSNPDFKNTIVYFNKKIDIENQIHLDGEDSYVSQPDFDYCNVQGGLSAFSGSGITSYNISNYKNGADQDPKFVGINEYPYRFKPSSPCIDIGNPQQYSQLPPFDIIQSERIFNSRIDLGAHEYYPTSAPVVVGTILDKNVVEPATFSFTISPNVFADSDEGDSLRFSAQIIGLPEFPDWLNFDAGKIKFNGAVSNSDIGVYTINITATDDYGNAATIPFVLMVKNTNESPYLFTDINDQSTTEGDFYEYTIDENTFLDDDLNDILTYQSKLANGSDLPLWLTFDENEQTFSGIPDTEDVGVINIVVTATDMSGNSASTSFSLEVNYKQHSPYLNVETPDFTILEDAPFEYIFSENTFEDINLEDEMLYQFLENNNLPEWLSFDTVDFKIYGTPTSDNLGTNTYQLIATDNTGLSSSDEFFITVENTNDPPYVQIPPPSPIEAHIGEVFSFSLPENTFADDDPDDELTFGASDSEEVALPDWLSFDDNDLKFSGTPQSEDIGVMGVKIYATDKAGESAFVQFTLFTNRATSIDNKKIYGSKLKVYPNPAREYIEISMSDIIADNGYIKIFSANGKMLQQFNVATSDFANGQLKKRLKLNELNTGVYFVKMILTNSISVGKLIIN